MELMDYIYFCSLFSINYTLFKIVTNNNDLPESLTNYLVSKYIPWTMSTRPTQLIAEHYPKIPRPEPMWTKSFPNWIVPGMKPGTSAVPITELTRPLCYKFDLSKLSY